MEQAINQFTRGLQMDTNHMVQGNDSMTDCLNGTLITMNGNEVILQNDMGNRRVEDAFLPSGYQPVGMKEYGGIIYVAAYNPITNKSQIGSFPSPERKVKLESIESKNMESICGDPFASNFINNDSEQGIKFLSSDSVLIPLSINSDNKEQLYIYPGDKFIVYVNSYKVSGNDVFKKYISNFNNIQDNKVHSPKNKQYTLSLGILNSQNEFVDITSQLERWDTKDSIISSQEKKLIRKEPLNLNEKSDLYKFNCGYFIPQCNVNPTNELTIDDSKFRENRITQPANTYSYKLIGPLYLKIQLNHITKFDYNIYADKDNDEATITIEATITYNCPDWITNNTQSTDIDYYTFEEGEITDDKFGFNFLLLNNNEIYEKLDCNLIKSTSTKYNKDTNEYIVTIEKKYTFNINNHLNDNKIKYCIGAIGSILSENIGQQCKENIYYLKELSQYGTLDPNLFNTGSVEIKEWRFFNNVENQTTELTFLVEAYPKKGQNLGSLKMELYPYEINSNNKIQTSENISYSIILLENITSGRHTILLDWNLSDNNIIETKKLYDVKLYRHYENLDLKDYYLIKGYQYIGSLDDYELKQEGEFYYYYPKHESPDTKIKIVDEIFFEGDYVPGQDNYRKYIIFYKENSQINRGEVIDYHNKHSLNIELINNNLWFLSTPLLNECYYFNSSKYAPHYCLKDSESKYVYSSIQELTNINPFYFLEISESGQFTNTQKGSLYYYKKDQQNKYYYTDYEGSETLLDGDPFFELEYNYDGNLKFKKVENDIYPDCVDLMFNENNIKLLDPRIEYLSVNDRSYNYKYSDKIECSFDNLNNDILIKKLFLRLKYVLQKIGQNDLMNCNSQFQIGISSRGETGPDDPHSLVMRQSKKVFNNNNDISKSYWDLITTIRKDGTVSFQIEEYKNIIFDQLDSYPIFLYGFGNVYYHTGSKANYIMSINNNIYQFDEHRDKITPQYSRMWWKTNKGNQYALVDKIINRGVGQSSDDNEIYNFSLINDLQEDFGNIVYNALDDNRQTDVIYTIQTSETIFPEKHNKNFDLPLKYNGENDLIYPTNIFSYDNTNNYDYKTITFNSSNKFFNIIEQFDPEVIECLYIDFDESDLNKIIGVLGTDVNSNILNSSTSYYRQRVQNNDSEEYKNKLIPTYDFIVNSQYKLDQRGEYYAPLYSGNNTEIKSAKYDNIEYSDGDQRTTLIYQKQVYVVPLLNTFKNNYTNGNTVDININPGSGTNYGGGSSGGGGGRNYDDKLDPFDRRNDTIQDLDPRI